MSETFSTKLVELARGTAERFGWYADLLSEQEPLSGAVSGLRLPLLTSEVLERHYYNQRPIASDVSCYFTSGTSSGDPKCVKWSTRDHSAYVEARVEVIRRHVGVEVRSACADLGTGHAASSALEIFAALGLRSSSIDFRRPIDDHVELLNRERPDLLFTMPMILDRLLARTDLTHRPRKILVLGDVAPEAWKHRVAQRLGITRGDVLDLYGSIEVGAIAFECEECRRYHFHDHILAEAVPTEALGFPPDEELQLLVLSSTARESFPAIRYCSGDLVRGFGLHRCGSGLRLGYERIAGRAGDEYKHGEKISLHDITASVNEVIGCIRFEVWREGLHLVVGLAIEHLDDSTAQRLRENIHGRCPAIAAMERSGLVGAITFRSLDLDAFQPDDAKRRIRALGMSAMK